MGDLKFLISLVFLVLLRFWNLVLVSRLLLLSFSFKIAALTLLLVNHRPLIFLHVLLLSPFGQRFRNNFPPSQINDSFIFNQLPMEAPSKTSQNSIYS